MARLIKTVEGQLVRCNIKTEFADGTYTIREIALNDIVEGLRYVENEQMKTVSGRVAAIKTICNSVTNVSMTNPKDYFAKDVMISALSIDASEQYHSDLVSVPGREIVENEGEVDVVKVSVSARPEVLLEMTYTDGTTVQQAVTVGDVLCNMVIKTSPGKSDITGNFHVAAFLYTSMNQNVNISGMYLTSLETGKTICATFDNIIRFDEKPAANVTQSNSLSQLADALNENDEVFAFFDTDVTIPEREDGRITTLMINEGKTLTVDLSGHALNTQAYAFYINGGTLVLRDTTGAGKITAVVPDHAYPVIQVNAGGTCNMEGGIIDTTGVDTSDGKSNWLYGVVCSGDGVFNMTGGKIITQDAAGISITNGTATGVGAQFNISGDAIITSNDCTAIYLADNKAVNISGNAVINGGVLMRMGNLDVSGKAIINGAPAGTDIYPLGKLVCESGCENHNAAILALTGCYGSDLGNDLNIRISELAQVRGYIDNAIDIATLNTKFDQNVSVDIVGQVSNIKYVDSLWNIYNHEQLAEMASEQGKTLPVEKTSTELTIKIGGSVVYPEQNEEE